MVSRVVRVTFRVVLLATMLYFTAAYLSARWSPDPELLPERLVQRLDRPAVDEARPHVARGVLSVHTGRSHDAIGTFDELGFSAEQAGLDFVVLGDHVGEWVRVPGAMAPRWSRDALIVPGLEMVISDRGRVLVFGIDTLPREWDAPLSDLVARVHPEDGFLSVVHPRSPRVSESWRDRDIGGVHAWESFDVSEMARSRLADRWVGYHVASLLIGAPTGRLDEALVGFWRERSETPAILAYDSARTAGPMTLTGGLNHHPKTRIRGRPMPGYTPFFRTVVNHVRLEEPFSVDPFASRRQLATALRDGTLFVTLGFPDRAHGFRFWIEDEDGRALGPGSRGGLSDGASMMVRIPDRAPGDVLVRFVRDGRETAWIESAPGETIATPVTGTGVWRVEVHHAGTRLPIGRLNLRPWILSNPIELDAPR